MTAPVLSLLATRLLPVVREHPQVTIGAACKHMDMGKAWRSKVAHAAAELERAGLVRRGYGDNEARPMTITTAGLAVLSETKPRPAASR